jgi:uncharacterized protein (TIGR03435 family)
MWKVLWVLFAFRVLAQPPSFEAATIKPSRNEFGNTDSDGHPGSLVIRGMSLKRLIGMAYQVKDFQVTGGPKWLDGDRFDINARAEGPADGPQRLIMLQTLLAERFQLVLHHEQKIAPAYALAVAKSGLKIKPNPDATGSGTKGSNGKLIATGLTMEQLADRLSRRLGAPVVDVTETPGRFDFKLEWSIEGDAAEVESAFLAAIQSQLGLKLESRKLPIDLIVVDRAEKPSEN